MTDREKELALRFCTVRPDDSSLAEILKKNIEEQEADNESNDPEH